MSDQNRIEKTIVLRAPRPRVWSAISDAKQFGEWFGVILEGSFAERGVIKGKITYPGYEHLMMEMQVERIQPETYFSYRWHPNAHEPSIDYSSEPMTLVEFKLEDVDGGTKLTIVETGFDQIPAARRAAAFKSNDGGWAEQTRRIERYVSQS